MMRQFNSRSGPVKAKFAYLCTNGYSRLRNALLLKLCTSWDDCAICRKQSWKSFSGISSSNVFTLRWMSESSANLCPLEHFLILERAKNRRELSQANKEDGPFL